MKLQKNKPKKKFNELCNLDCPVRKSMDVLDGKWTILILRDLLGGTKRFGELKKSLGDLNPKTLTDRLKQLEKNNILTKKIYAEVPLRVEYSLTKKGAELRFVIEALAKWGSQWN